MCLDRSVMICVGATTVVDAIKKALAEAEEKVAKEQAACKKLKARLNEVHQERTNRSLQQPADRFRGKRCKRENPNIDSSP